MAGLYAWPIFIQKKTNLVEDNTTSPPDESLKIKTKLSRLQLRFCRIKVKSTLSYVDSWLIINESTKKNNSLRT